MVKRPIGSGEVPSAPQTGTVPLNGFAPRLALIARLASFKGRRKISYSVRWQKLGYGDARAEMERNGKGPADTSGN
jgi:hypothetical protein